MADTVQRYKQIDGILEVLRKELAEARRNLEKSEEDSKRLLVENTTYVCAHLIFTTIVCSVTYSYSMYHTNHNAVK
jgi:hypothetical protein